MKKLASVMLAAALMLSLCACGLDDSQKPVNTNPVGTNPVIEGNTCNVDFDMNGSWKQAPATQYVTTGYAAEPAEPARTGYTFGGWYTDKECTDEWLFESDKLSNNILLYAKWTIDTYTITFDLAGGTGTVPQSQTLNYRQKVTAPAETPAKNGFVFCGWWAGTSAGNFTQEWNFGSDLPSKDMTLYAGWGTEGTEGAYTYQELANCIKITACSDKSDEPMTLDIPDTVNGKNVLSIGMTAFKDSYKTHILLPANLTTINEFAFQNCASIDDMVFSENVTSIGKNAFNGCSGLCDVHLNNKMTCIGERAFYSCTSVAYCLDYKLEIPSSVIMIDKEAFRAPRNANNLNNALKFIEFANGIEVIGDSAFRYADIEKINIPDSIEIIESNAFASCSLLDTVQIGKCIKSIGSDAFAIINPNSYIVIYAKVPPELKSMAVFGILTLNGDGKPATRTNFYISVPLESLDVYKTATNWSRYSAVMIPYVLTDNL